MSYTSFENDDDIGDERSADTSNGDSDARSAEFDEEHRSADDSEEVDNNPPVQRAAGGYNLRTRRSKPTYNHRLDWMMDKVDTNAKSYETQLLQQAVDVSYRMDKSSDEREYGMQFLQSAVEKADTNPGDLFEYVTHFMFNQMSAKKGIAKHGDKAIAAQLTEFSQLEDKEVYEGIHVNDLTPTERRGALRAINLIKEKRSGKIKGRMVADGSTQRDLTNTSERCPYDITHN
jgi:hypothetical protein